MTLGSSTQVATCSYVCEICKFLHSTYIIISNQVMKAKMIMPIGFILINLCTEVTTDVDVSSWMETIVHKGAPVPLFKAPTPWPRLAPFFKSLFPLPSFLFHPLLRYFRQFPPPAHKPLPPLIRPTNLPWFKQISKRWFYQFNCCFLSKINF